MVMGRPYLARDLQVGDLFFRVDDASMKMLVVVVQKDAKKILARRTADNWTEKVREDVKVCRVRIEFRFDYEFEEIPF